MSARLIIFQKKNQVLLIEFIRISLLTIFLGVLLFKFFSFIEFINIDGFFPVYFILMTSFLVHAFYVFFLDRVSKNKLINELLFFYEVLLISSLAYFLSLNSSIYIFMFLLNIFLSGLLLRSRGAWSLALFTSCFFHGLLFIRPPLGDGALFPLLLINNLAFFVTAGLSSSFGEKIRHIKTELSQKKHDLKLLKNLNQMIVENIGTSLLAIDQEGEIIYANRATEKIFETSKLVGLSLNTLFPELNEALKKNQKQEKEQKQKSHAKMNNAPLLLKKPPLKRKPSHNRFNSEERIIEVFISSLFNFTREPEESLHSIQGYVILLHDKTEVLHLETLLRQKEKLAAIGQLASGIAHEIRNPLASISGSIQLLASSHDFSSGQEQTKQEEEEEEKRTLLKIILKEIHRLDALISEFLNYVKPEDYVLSPLDLNQVIKEVLESIQLGSLASSTPSNTQPNAQLHAQPHPSHTQSGLTSKASLFSKNIKKKFHLEGEHWIHGHFEKLKQVFWNFFTNAFQALEDVQNPTLEIETSTHDGKVCVKISDNGVGIAEKDLNRIFEPFHTTKEKGTGLGLSVSYKILEKHGAKVEVKSKPKKGTQFKIQFPCLS